MTSRVCAPRWRIIFGLYTKRGVLCHRPSGKDNDIPLGLSIHDASKVRSIEEKQTNKRRNLSFIQYSHNPHLSSIDIEPLHVYLTGRISFPASTKVLPGMPNTKDAYSRQHRQTLKRVEHPLVRERIAIYTQPKLYQSIHRPDLLSLALFPFPGFRKLTTINPELT